MNHMLSGIIPCGGYGTRLTPLTHSIPKALIPIGGKPLIAYSLSIMKALDVGRVIVIIGSHTQAVKDYIGPSYEGLLVQYVLQDPALGLLDAVFQARHLVEDQFLTLLSDEIYIGCNHQGFVEKWKHQSELAGLIGYVKTADSDRIRQNYSITMNGRRVKRLEEKPRLPTNRRLGTGTWALHRSFFEAAGFVLRHNPPERHNFVDALQIMIEAGSLMEGYDLNGGYVNVNSACDIDLAESLL